MTDVDGARFLRQDTLGMFVALEKVRDLHEINDYGDCTHCYDDGPVSWPCSTAALVYSGDEVKDITRTWWLWHRWGQEREKRRWLARGWDATDDMNQMIGRQMRKRLLERPFILSRLLVTSHPRPRSWTYEITNDPAAGSWEVMPDA